MTVLISLTVSIFFGYKLWKGLPESIVPPTIKIKAISDTRDYKNRAAISIVSAILLFLTLLTIFI